MLNEEGGLDEFLIRCGRKACRGLKRYSDNTFRQKRASENGSCARTEGCPGRRKTWLRPMLMQETLRLFGGEGTLLNLFMAAIEMITHLFPGA